jgi:hypothetical protein
VLVHGAFASQKDGYQTATPALGLASVSGDVAIVCSTLDSIPGDKILVGHSGHALTLPSRAGLRYLISDEQLATRA